MAGKKAKKVSMSAEELEATKALELFVKQHEGKVLTDPQKAKKAELQTALGKMKFVRIANKRIPKALAAIKGVRNLAGKTYVKTAVQIKAICDALENEVKALRAALGGVKESKGGFSLPGFEVKSEGEEKK